MVMQIQPNANPEDLSTLAPSETSAFIWLDILGFSELSENDYDTRLLEQLQAQFNCDDIQNVREHIISDGLLFEITCTTEERFLEILNTLNRWQFEWTLQTKQVLRGGISTGRKIQNKNNSNSICATNGLSRAHAVESRHIKWPIIGTTTAHLICIKKHFNPDLTEEDILKLIRSRQEIFGLKHTLNTNGDDLYFLDFLNAVTIDSETNQYKQFLCEKIKRNLEDKSKGNIQLKYLWLWKHFTTKFPNHNNGIADFYKQSVL